MMDMYPIVQANMQKAARAYYDQGANVVVGVFVEEKGEERKKPLVKWEQWQTQRQTIEEFDKLPFSEAHWIGVICGQKLNNGLYLGAVDIDRKKVAGEAIDRGRELSKTLPITQREGTRNNGEHLIYYCQKKPQPTASSKVHEWCGVDVLGEHRLCIMFPSIRYSRITDNEPTTIEDLNETVTQCLKKIGFKEETDQNIEVESIETARNIRPCIAAMTRKTHLEHHEKLAVVVEHFYAGWNQAQIEDLFKEHKSWEPEPDHHYDSEKTRSMIKSVLEHKPPYKPFKCTTIKNVLKDCLPNCPGPKKRSVERGGQQKEEFNPVAFAKRLMHKRIFRTMRDNEDVYVFDDLRGIYKPLGESIIKEEMVKELDEETRKQQYADVLFYIQGSTYLDRPHNPFNSIAIDNGLLDVETHEISAYTPEHFITSALPVAYKKDQDCPRIKQFLSEVVGDTQIPLVQEAIGYCLYKAMPIHKALMLIGDGANGKSTLLELIKKFLGSENVANASLQALCFNRFSIAQLYGKLANICADLPSTTLTQTGTFKMLTGSDTISAEEKFKQPFSFKNHAKLFFSTNKVPETADDTTAFFRRWLLIVCNNVFTGEKCNPNILDEISTPEELSGLLNFALEGLDRLLKQGHFSTAESLEDLRKQYIRKSNSAKAFIEERMEYVNDARVYIPVAELYERYAVFCQAEHLPSMQKRLFTQNMQQHLPQAKKVQTRIEGRQIWCWQFVRVVTTVTTCLFKHSQTMQTEQDFVTPSESESNSVTEYEVKNNGKLCLDKPPVTPVTDLEKAEATTCHLCLKVLPRDHTDTTIFESREVHIPCFRRLMDGRNQPSD